MPNAYAGIAVGWTKYNFVPGSRTSVASTQTYLDLYAVHVLALGSAPAFVTLPSDLQNQMVDARTFLSPAQPQTPVPEFQSYYGMIATICTMVALLIIRRRK